VRARWRIDRALTAGAALFGLSAAIALALPPRVPAIEVKPAGIAAADIKAATPTGDNSAADAVIDGNIFSAARKAPAKRFNPAEPDEPVVAEEPAANVAEPISEEARVPRLFGIVVGPGGATALLRLDPANPEAQVYREGDTGGRYRVVQINEKSVIVEGPSGRIELRLPRPEGTQP
jgi:hypothetical protein